MSPEPVPRGEWPLTDSVKPYVRHVLACMGTTDWPARLESAPGLLGRMASDARGLREGDVDRAKFTAIDEPSPEGGVDLIVFPEGIRYRAVDRDAWSIVVAEHLIGGRVPERLEPMPVCGRYALVCGHQARDERCGRCGPPLAHALRRACAEADLEDVAVVLTSHVGGHKYAGNMIIYPDGVWYGYVRPEDAASIVQRHFVHGTIVDELYRGSMRSP